MFLAAGQRHKTTQGKCLFIHFFLYSLQYAKWLEDNVMPGLDPLSLEFDACSTFQKSWVGVIKDWESCWNGKKKKNLVGTFHR